MTDGPKYPENEMVAVSDIAAKNGVPCSVIHHLIEKYNITTQVLNGKTYVLTVYVQLLKNMVMDNY